jgi:peptidoglycan/xylan/chitin deacetylase (PgdA/CDA1 family)
MAGNARVGVRVTHFVIMLGLAAGTAEAPAFAADCPRPDALGTSRTLVVDAKAHPLIGSMQYRETLPLNDGEVVLTFDDGPIPINSYQVLDILAAQCVKATFFLVGRQAQANPEGVRKLLDAGHTVATHTQNHPYAMQRLPLDRAKAEIDGGIASVTAALGERSAAISPFFRIPGLSRNDGIEEYAKEKGLQVWSTDFLADDWHHISSARVYDLAMKRLAAKGKGILLLHDIQARTVAALPRILNDLKARGYRIVHVVPATPEKPATPTEPQQWRLYPTSELIATSRWPKIPGFAFVQQEVLPAPLLTDSYWNDVKLRDRPQARGRSTPLPRPAPWPRQLQLASIDAASALPVPAASVFDVEEGVGVVMMGMNATRPVERRVVAETEAKPTRVAARGGKRAPAVANSRARRVATSQSARPVTPPAAHADRTASPPKRAVHSRKNGKPAGRHSQEASAQPSPG